MGRRHHHGRSLIVVGVGVTCMCLLVLQYHAWHVPDAKPPWEQRQIGPAVEFSSSTHPPCDPGEWAPWSVCSKTCDGGRSFRIRQPKHPQQNLALCYTHKEASECNPQPCTPPLMCKFGFWSPWSLCTGTPCAEGTRTRFRNVTPPDAPGCPSSHQLESCKVACPADHAVQPEGDADPDHPMNDVLDEHANMSVRNDLINCQNAKDIKFIDDGPFGKGYARAAWRAKFKDLDMVIKRPVGTEHPDRYAKGVKWEVRWLRTLKSDNILKFYGECTEPQNLFTAVEGNLTKWSHVLERPLPWCYKLQLAIEVAEVVVFLEEKQMIHCDWKYDQAAIDPQGRVKLVDIKSVRNLRKEGQPYKSSQKCQSHKKCKKCFKMLDMKHEHKCVMNQGYCHGYGTKAMVLATVKFFFPKLFYRNNQDFPPDLHNRIEHIATQCSADDPQFRWTPKQLLSELRNVANVLEAETCLTKTRVKTLSEIRQAYAQMFATRAERCKGRYC
eukprot:m.121370 g.121370  ORF g.121370 m.121370 type:complete len:497 (+) comp23276_c0_seq1:24-1514(+)